MRTAALLAGLAFAALASTTAHAASPYAPSNIRMSWNTATYRWSGSGGDIWPVTWSSTGPLVTAWGDGVIGCGTKASYGWAQIVSNQPSTTLEKLHCGPVGSNKGKVWALGATPGALWAVMLSQSLSTFSHGIWRSGDGGKSWTAPGRNMSYTPDAFIQFGQGATGPGGFAYMLNGSGSTTLLIRAPAASVANPATHEYFSGTATAPAWTRNRTAAKSVFTDPAGVRRPTMTYVPGLQRYLLMAAHSKVKVPSSNRMGIFEGPSPWGPWRTVYYVDNFLGMRGGSHLGMDFPIKWQSGDGRTLWATFSCHDSSAKGSCGQYHDRFNLMQATLTVGQATLTVDSAGSRFEITASDIGGNVPVEPATEDSVPVEPATAE